MVCAGKERFIISAFIYLELLEGRGSRLGLYNFKS